MLYDCNLTETDEDSGYCCPLNDAKEREEE